MQVTLLVVGLIVGFALGLGAGWYFWHGAKETEERAPARRPRSYEPSTPPQHRPTPRPRPITAMRHATSASTAGARRPIPFVEPAAVREPAPPPAVAVAEPAARVPDPEPSPEPAGAPIRDVEYRPTPRREGPVSIEEPEHADRHVLQELLEANRRLTADAELRLRREGAGSADQLQLGERPPARPVVSPPAPDDLLARHRMLDQDSRRMGRRQD